MQVQKVNNQQSFGANANFRPAISNNCRMLLERYGKFRSEAYIQPFDADTLIEELIDLAGTGKIKPTKQVIVPQKHARHYTEFKTYDLDGDTMVIYTKPNFSTGQVGSSAIIDIEHSVAGYQGTTTISREYPRKDEMFDALAERLNELG